MLSKLITLFRRSDFQVVFLGFIVVVLAYITYFQNYWDPPLSIYDEYYHVPAAEKYRNGIFFMEPHPPLGKLAIVLGEYLSNSNSSKDVSALLTTAGTNQFPEGFSFSGVRLFPVLFGVLSSVLLFLILYSLSEKAVLSFLFTFLYLFDNALIIHSRAAQLESTQIFFILLCSFYFIRCCKKILSGASTNKTVGFKEFTILGILCGIALSVKLSSGILLTLPAVLIFIKLAFVDLRGKKSRASVFKNTAIATCLFFLSGLSVFIGIYYVHFVISSKVLAGQTYGASSSYLAVLNRGRSFDLNYFPLQLYEHLAFVARYESQIPKFDLTSAVSKGSLPIGWPIGIKAISYRWELVEGEKMKYLYLQGNPIVWLIGLTGVVVGIARIGLFLSSPRFKKHRHNVFFLACFVGLYLAYGVGMMVISRVLYLFHYLIPLVLSFIISYLAFLPMIEAFIKKCKIQTLLLVCCIAGLVVGVFVFFSPLTYFQPLSHKEFNDRAWFPFWGLTWIDSPK